MALESSDSDNIGDKNLAKYILHVASGVRNLEEFVFQQFRDCWSLQRIIGEHGLDKINKI